MKKLMTVIAAVGMAFGLFAESKLNNAWKAEPTTTIENWNEDGLWSGAIESVEIGTSGVAATPVIKFKTGSSALSRTVEAGGFDADGNVFFDTYIDLQGQALDELPTVDTSAKIALFALDMTDEEPASVPGFYALAQYGAAGQALFALGDDTVDIDVITNGLHRITIKAYDNVMSSGTTARPGFVCFIDGVNATEQAKVLKVTHVYGITEGVVDWSTDLIDTNPSYLGLAATAIDVSAITRFNDKQLLLSLLDGAATFSAVDFIGTASVADITMNDTGFDYLPEDVQAMMLSLADDVTVVAEPSAALVGNTIVAGCTLTASCTDTSKTVFVMEYDGTPANVTQNGNVFTIDDSEPGTMLSITAYAPVATVDGVGYETIAKAIAAANTAAATAPVEIELADGVTLKGDDGEIFNGTAAITLDLMGKAITSSAVNNDTIRNTGILIITDSVGNGSVSAAENMAAVANDGTLTIENGIFNALVYNAGALTINGGVFNDEVENDKGTLGVAGGTFFDENATSAEKFYLKDYLANNTKVKPAAEANYWTVVAKGPTVAMIGDDEYESLAEAFAAAKDGDVINVTADSLNETAAAKITGTGKADFNVIVSNDAYTVCWPTNATTDLYAIMINGATVTFGGNGTWKKESGSASLIQAGATADADVIIDAGNFVVGKYDERVQLDKEAPSNLIASKWGNITVNGGSFVNYRWTEGRCVRAEGTPKNVSKGIDDDRLAKAIIYGGTFEVTTDNPTESPDVPNQFIAVDNKGQAQGSVEINGGKFKSKHYDRMSEWCGTGFKLKKESDSDWYVRTAISYATFTVATDVGVASYVVSNDTEAVDSTAKFDIDDKVVLTVYPTLNAGYKLADTSYLTDTLDTAKTYEFSIVTEAEQTEPIPVPVDDPVAVSNALDEVGIPAGNPLYATVTTAADVEALNAFLKANSVTDAKTLTTDQKAYLNDSFLMKDVIGTLLAAEAKIEITEVSTTGFSLAIKVGANPATIKTTAADFLKGKVVAGAALDNMKSISAGQVTVVSYDAAAGTASFTLTYGDATSGFLKVVVTK